MAAIHVDRRVRLAAQRLEELAADEAQAASVRAARAGGCAGEFRRTFCRRFVTNAS